jgi:CDP-diacylglycerol--serine O-phosphatidyltransferase
MLKKKLTSGRKASSSYRGKKENIGPRLSAPSTTIVGANGSLVSSKGKVGKQAFAFSFYHLLPNIITLVALCFGLTSIRYSLDGNWERAACLTMIAAFLDGMDGRVARYLNASSPFGANLDSLADFVDFGVAPALIIYLWSLSAIGVHGLGWGAVLIFAICGATRLARFNVAAGATSKSDNLFKFFFIGIPIPVGALLALIPLMISLEFDDVSWVSNPWFNFFYIIILGFAMASRIPTFSIKHIKVSREKIKLLFACIGSLIVALIIKPWLVMIVMSVIYVLSIPISVMIFCREKRRLGEA